MDSAENESNVQCELRQSGFVKELENHKEERDLSYEMKICSNNEHTTTDKTLETEDEALVLKSSGSNTEVNNFGTDNSEGVVCNKIREKELEQVDKRQNNDLDSETDTDISNKDKHEQSSDRENKRLENINVSNKKLRIVNSDSEDEEIFSRSSKKEPVRDESESEISDSEQESKSRKQSKNTRIINKFFDSDSNDSIGSDTEGTASNKVVSQMKSRFQSLIDSESEEDDQEGRQDEEPLSPDMYNKKTKKHKSESSKPEKKKLSVRASKEEAMKQIKSETQRLIRESRISLPYHRPKQRTLQEFLSRKKVMSVLPKAPTMAAKLKMSSAIVDEMLKEKEKEAEVFYKSSDSEEEEGCVLKKNKEEMNATCIQEAKKDNVSRKLFTEDDSTGTESNDERDNTNVMDVTLTEPVEINRENINEEQVSRERVPKFLEDDTSSKLISKDNLIIFESAKEADSESAMDITLTEIAEIEDNKKIVNDEVDTSDFATIESHSKLEIIPKTVDLLQKHASDNETADVIETDKQSSENLNKESTASTSKVSEDYANMIKLSLGVDTDESDDYKEYGLPPPKFDDSPNINQNKTLWNMKPKLRGNPGTLIDLTSDVRPSKKGIDDLIDRFVHKHSKANERVKETNVTTVQVKESPNGMSIVKETLPYRLPNTVEEDPKLNKPGAKLVKLKEELKHKMALKRDEEWKLREQEMKEQEIEWNESINEEDSFTEVYSPSTESHKSDEDEPIEDDVHMKKEKKKRSAFIDYEAEVSEDDIENDTDDIEDEDEDDAQEEKLGLEDEDEDEDSDTNEQNKTFKRIIVPLEEDSRSSMIDSDKNDREDNLPRTTSLNMFRRNSNESESNISISQVPKTIQTPQTKSNSFSLVSPATQLTALNAYVEDGETPKKGKQISHGFDSIARLINTQEDVLDEDLIGLCSGKFPESKFGLNFTKETNVSDSQLLDICSGKFTTQPNNDMNLVDSLNEAPQNMQISEEKSGKKREEQLKEKTPCHKFRVLSSDEEDAAEEIKRSKKKKKVIQLNVSEDEEENGSAASSEDEEVEEEIDDERFIDYDSDENEIIVPKKNIKEYAAKFLEEEAELSESDGGEVSADEDEQELDKFEVEDGDDEDIDEAQVKDQVGKLHMRQLLDEDQREVKMLQDLLFEDGDLYSETGRERKFRWRNIDKQDDNNDLQPLEEKDGLLDLSDNEEEVNWRKMRYEREKFLAEKKASSGTEIEDTLNSQIFKVGMKIVKKRRIDENRKEETLVETIDSKVESRMPRTIAEMINATKFGDKTHVIHTAMKKHSFLARGEKSLERLASLAKQRSAPLPSLKRKNFVFAHVDLNTENADNSVEKSVDNFEESDGYFEVWRTEAVRCRSKPWIPAPEDVIRGRTRRRPSPGQTSLFQFHCHEGHRIIQHPRASIATVFVATPTMESRERYQELCRLCASYDAVKMDIFGQEGKNRQLVDKIQACLPFKIAEDDRLPKCLCYRCMYNLENFYDFRTACVNAVALLERCLPPSELNGNVTTTLACNDSELFERRESIPLLIPEAPIVNPNAALGTPPRLNSDGEADHDVEDMVDNSGTDEGTMMDDNDDHRSEEYELDMETNPSDFLEMTSIVAEEPEESELRQQKFVNLAEQSQQQHEVYVCSLCDKAFSSKGHLSLHARIHVGAGDVIGEKVLTDDHTSYKRPYQCDLCHKSYSTAKHRWGHVSTTHRGHPAVTCGYCSRIYSTRTNLEEHIKSRHAGLPAPTEIQPDNRCQCNVCGKICTDIVELNNHGKICGGQRFDTPTKNETISDNKILDSSEASSIASDDDIKDYRNAEAKLAKNPQLTILKQALTKGESLKRDFEDKYMNCKPNKYLKTEHTDAQNSKKWYCESCPQAFSSVEDLKEHEAVHDADKPFICILCRKDFVLKSSLSRHIQTLHGIDPAPIVESDKCLKRFLPGWNESIDFDSYEGKMALPLSPNANIENEEEHESGQENLIEIETVFVCEVCTRDFNDRASLWLHIRATHKEFAAFACGVCLKICADNTQLLNHVSLYHGGSKLLLSEQRRYSCTICGRQHDSRKKLITHVSIHNLDQSYDPATFVQLNTNYYGESMNGNETAEQMLDFEEDMDKVDCHICYKSFPTEDHLIRHQRNAHKSEPLVPTGDLNSPNMNGGNRAQYHLFFVCELCGSSHPSKWERWLHVSSTHEDEPSIKCDREDCGKIFATKSLRNDHTQHHAIQGSSPNTCEICGKLWGSRVDYWKHVMGVHSDTVPLICGVCLKVFPNVLQLSNHVKSKHWPLTNGDFSCDICGRPYSNKSKMSRHRKIHGFDDNYDNGNEDNSENKIDGGTKEPELRCELCTDMVFATLEKLCNHRRMVHGLFPCDLCNKYYGRTSHLWKHVNRVHKGHADITCPYCMKTSASKDHLAAHISKIHRYEHDSANGSTTYKNEEVNLHYCEKCNKGFHKRYLLRRHMKGCQNYRKDPSALLTRCRACERIFKDRASLQKHIENHHSTYTCHLCEETVTSKLGIMTHNRMKHMNHPDLTCNFGSCKKLFRTQEDLESHKKDHRYHTTPNVCDYCGDTVENKLKLKMHVLSLHRNEIGVSCGVCLIPMRDPKELKNHVENVHSMVLTKPNTCQVCGKQYASKWKAFDHTKKCHGKVFSTCKQCLAVFTDKSSIIEHYQAIHNITQDQLPALETRFEIIGRRPPADMGSPPRSVKDEPDDSEYFVDMLYEDPNEEKQSPSRTFSCEMCPEMLVNGDALAVHYLKVHNTDPVPIFERLPPEELKRVMGKIKFYCKNCLQQFYTKTLYWTHVETCKPIIRLDELFPNQIEKLRRDGLLKNNNLIKNEEEPASNLNIPDFNLFEGINLQLSGQRPLPNLMPLPQRTKSTMKCSRKDSRKVYDESTNTECACEVCGKQWPAKKHLWQHLIRFHRTEAAVTCGVCLKLCKDYDDLSEHLKAAHEAILSTEGNNFTCKICGRYHNARSKLLLHTSIHIGHAGTSTWCPKCRKNITDESVHACTEKIEEAEQLQNNEKAEGSLIADDGMIEEVEEGEFESEAEEDEEENIESDAEESESGGSSTEVEEENESEGESRATGEVTYNSESEDSQEEIDNLEIGQTNMQHYLLGHLQETKNAEAEKHADLSDDDDDEPPVLSPMMPMLAENTPAGQSASHQFSPSAGNKEEFSPKPINLYENHLPNNKSSKFEPEAFVNRSDEDTEDTKNESDENSVEDNEEIEEYEENEDVEANEQNEDELDEEMEFEESEEIEADREDNEQVEANRENDEFEKTKDDDRNDETVEESEDVNQNAEMDELGGVDGNEVEDSDQEEGDDAESIDLERAVIMMDDGDQLVIQQEMLEDDGNENSNEEFVYSTLRYSTEEDSEDARK
ncbi:uncharacterized protein LOC108626685 [Ceratina calcarata]|uniref:Uncharacterized protein LOC108626685 n=1 Tax=Ceratina calcarata TaxID=156304 RepID=A0AAJ7S3R5_9HYME|nr:uncharacterized protein LOC108626685 [Ceratina calcarata]